MRAGLARPAAGAAALAERARQEGRRLLLEHEVYPLLERAGLRPPPWTMVEDAAGVAAGPLAALGSHMVAVKVLSPALAHRSDRGGVLRVAARPSEVAAAIAGLEEQFPREERTGFLIAAWLEHDTALDAELLLGYRDTPDFGPVVVVGPGGLHAEFLAEELRAEAALAFLAPGLHGPEEVDAALRSCAVADLATRPFRGRPPRAPLRKVREAVLGLLELAPELSAAGIAELEANPVALVEGSLVALDALGRLAPADAPRPAPPRPLEKLDALLRPRSIAILGVSERPNPGRIILENTLRAGFPRERVVLVKPGRTEMLGCRCVPELGALTRPVDLLILAVGARQVPDIVEQVAGEDLAASIIAIPGGMGEHREGAGLAARTEAVLRESRTRLGGGPILNGANCLGIRSRPGRYDTLFIPAHKLPAPRRPEDPLALISQSGAFAVARASRLAALNPRYVVTAGNQMDLTVADFLEGLARDPELRVFACYVEGFRPGDGRRFLEISRELATEGRSVILYRAGRTGAGAAASASHTASLAGDARVSRALAGAAGVMVADTLEDFEDLTRLATFLDGRALTGLRLGAVSNAGFECVAMADNLGPFRLAAFAPATRRRLEALLREARLESIVEVHNPLDLTPILGDAPYEEAVRAILEDPGVDLGLVGVVPLTGQLATLARGPGHDEDASAESAVTRRLVRLFGATTRPWAVVVDGGPLYDPMAAVLEAGRVPVFRGADRALRTLATWAAVRQRMA